jgi:phage N-6-adenine-methyltransferase
MSNAISHLKSIGVNDEWETPVELYCKAIEKFQIFPKIDVCATKHNTKCAKFLSKENDFIKSDISEDFWMNPPYSRQGRHTLKSSHVIWSDYGIEDYIKHAYELHKKHNNNAIILTFAKTDTEWFHNYVYDEKNMEWIGEFHPIRRRIRFLIDGNEGKNVAPYPSCFIVYRSKKWVLGKR